MAYVAFLIKKAFRMRSFVQHSQKPEHEKLALKQKMYRQAENLNKKVQRRESRLDTVTREVEALNAQLAILNEGLRVAQAANIELQLENRRLERNVWAAKRRASETMARQSAMYTSSANVLRALSDEEDIDSMRQKKKKGSFGSGGQIGKRPRFHAGRTR